jgi:hypothetical protein
MSGSIREPTRLGPVVPGKPAAPDPAASDTAASVPGAGAHPRPKPARPDARPMRAALGAGGLAALSAIAAAIFVPPNLPATTVLAPPAQQPVEGPVATDGVVPPGPTPTRPIQYVQLKPGETVPPGAQVIAGSAPPPVTVAVPLKTPAPVKVVKPPPAPTPIVIKTTQSGKVVP